MFQLDNTTPTASNGTFLAANAIHKVKLELAEAVEVGKDKHQVVQIKMVASDGSGSFTDSIFEPKSNTREETGTQKYLSPSEVEQFQAKLRQYIAAFNPALDKEINDGTKKIGAKDWDGMRAVIVQAINGKANKNVGREVELKLLKSGKGYAQVPGFVAGLTKPDSNGVSKVYHRTKFIGEGLSFTDSEMTTINKQSTAKPSEPSVSDELMGGGSTGSADDLDFEFDEL